MIHRCPCGFHTDDELWFTSHQAKHLLSGDRHDDVGEWTGAELERARRDLAATRALAYPGSPMQAVAAARISAIDAELAVRAGDGLPGSPLSPESLAGFSTAGGETAPVSLGAGAVVCPG